MSGNRLLVCLLLSALAFGQAHKQSPPPPRKLVAVVVTGSSRYKPEDIIAATGLHLGEVATEDDFNRATRDLSATGLFTDVAYTYNSSAPGTRLEIKLTDNDRMVPTHFENIVWFSDDELLRELTKRVPLFHGQVPVGGNLADQVSDAIQAMLLENRSPGHVDYVRAGPEGGPVDSVNYSVDNVSLRVESVKILGAAPADASALAANVEKFSGHDYSRDGALAWANAQLLPYYLARGYLKAAFGPPQPRVKNQTEDEVALDVELPLEQGRTYTLSGFQWSGNKVLSSERLQGLIHLAPNQLVDGVQLAGDLADVAKLYGTRGYVHAVVKPSPHFDDSQGTVFYDLEVQEGDLYRMGELEIRGLDSRTTAQLQEAWTIRLGAPYDTSYSKAFLEAAWKYLAKQVDWTVAVHEAVDERERVVDVSLVYGVRASH